MSTSAFKMANNFRWRLIRGNRARRNYSIKVNNEKDFQEKIEKCKDPIIVDFCANWCKPCKELEPRLQTVLEKYKGKIEIAKVDIDNLAEVAAKCDVGSIPSLIVFRNGKMDERLVGLHDETRLTMWVESILEKSLREECKKAKITI